MIRYSVKVKIVRKAKLNAENIPIYEKTFLGLYFTYSRSVIRLASDDIRVPTPPIFTPIKSSL